MARSIDYAQAYYDPSNPGSFGGVNKLWKEVGGTKRHVEAWLSTQDTYTLHRPARKHMNRNRILVAGLDDQWEADLVDVHSLKNGGIKFLLTVIDVLSKKAFVVPLKDKSAQSVIKAFKSIFKERQPRKIRTDSGREFVNQHFKQFLKKKGILFFTSNNETKCAIVERFNRSLMSRMWRYFTTSGQQRYLHVLQQLVDGYNKTRHSSTGYAPDDVNVMNGETVWRKLYDWNPQHPEKRQKPKYKVGDLVRISKAKKTFEKGYRTNWSREIFKVDRVYRRALPEYALKDLQDEPS